MTKISCGGEYDLINDQIAVFLCCANVKIVMNARNILKMKTLESKLILYY